MSKIDYKYEAEQLLIGGVIYCKFLVEIVKSDRTGCDVFICGEDDFEPQEFKQRKKLYAGLEEENGVDTR